MNITRRSMVSGGVAGVGASVLAACSHTGHGASATSSTQTLTSESSATKPATWFAGKNRRQSGIADAPATYGHWLGLDLAKPSKENLRRTLVVLSDAASRLVAGSVPLTDDATELAPRAGDVSITIGLGPAVFDLEGMPKPPTWLKPLPKFSIDKFEKPWNQTDLVVKIGGNDPIRTSHAASQLSAAAKSLASVTWRQLGNRPHPSPTDAGVVRNHFGQLDGQVNPSGRGADAHLVWNSGGNGVPGWMADSSAMVIRRIRMDVETWDSLDREARENSIGRRLSNGAPLTSSTPNAPMDLEKTDELGLPVINPAAHAPRAMATKPGEKILRRPYNYERETDDGRSDKGLIFVAFCADVETQFTPIQRRLAEADILNTWTTPIGSAVYFIPQAPRAGEYLGQTVLEARG